jgi:hypothetical protein
MNMMKNAPGKMAFYISRATVPADEQYLNLKWSNYRKMARTKTGPGGWLAGVRTYTLA